MSAKAWCLYLVRCRHGSLYTGISTDVLRRFAEHQQGGAKAARYLRGKGPLQLVYQVPVGARGHATRLEMWLKKQPRSTKESLITRAVDIHTLFAALDNSGAQHQQQSQGKRPADEKKLETG